jgi:hypothetical protein
MTPRTVWNQLKEAKAATAVLAWAVAIGFTLALLLGGYVGLPERVTATETVNTRQDAELQEARRNQDRILCLLEVMALDQSPLRCAR